MFRTRPLAVHALFAATLILLTGLGRQARPEDVSDKLEAIRAKQNIPALGAAAIRAGEVVALGVTGVRRAGGEEKVTDDDLWHLGSCTKAMTATLIARLVERGDMEWGTTIAEAFPDLKAEMDPAWHAVTVELLLQNRAGAPSDLSADGLWGRLWSHTGTPMEARRELLLGVTAHPPEYEPGSKNVYSNAGFAMAGHMAETITRVPWEGLMQREVFVPLGMSTAGFGAPGSADTVDQPRGHNGSRPVDPGLRADNPVAIGPAGIVHASLGDWAKFAAVHLKGARAEETGYLTPETFVKLHAPGGGGAEGYAMGWGVATRGWAKGDKPGDTGRVLSHGGSNTVWYCVIWIAPERDFAAIATANAANSKAADEAIQAMIKEALR